MKLTNITLHKYKSFLSEQSLSIEDKTTRIVGKNESGKSAILEALAKSNYFEEDKAFEFDKELDYPRRDLTLVKNENPKAITCQYEIEAHEMEAIEKEFCKGILPEKIFLLTSYYDNSKKPVNLRSDLKLYKEWLIDKFQIGDEGKKALKKVDDWSTLKTTVQENTSISGFDNIKAHFADLMPKDGAWNDIVACHIYYKHLYPNLPKMWYFGEYQSMPYRVDLNEIAKFDPDGSLTANEHKLLKALFELSGLAIEDILDEDKYESFRAQLEATSNRITDEMFEYWSTNRNLEINFEIEHKKDNKRFLNIRIKNTSHKVTLPLKNRSKGFLWFFSFLVWFSKINTQGNDNYILLLDEPGLNLHASAQSDLLRFIDEKLAPRFQVIYTTHSPFMIDSEKLHEIRTVYDNQDPKVGSTVSDALEEKDSDTLFPLQAALGYSIAQNLFVSRKNLLVEGISDLAYLQYFSSLLHSLNRTGLQSDITIVPVGGADKISTFISLMRGNKLSIACLLDKFLNQSAQARLNNLVEQKIIRSKNILYYSDFWRKHNRH